MKYKKEIEKALKEAEGNQIKAADLLGWPRTTLQNRMRKLKLKKKEYPTDLNSVVPDSELVISKKTTRFVITSAQNNTEIHKPFFKALLNYCEKNNAQLIIIPIRYKNVNAYSPTDFYTVFWPDEMKHYILNFNLDLNKNLSVLGALKIQATSSSPLTGLGPFTNGKSAIIGHAQVQMHVLPAPAHETPRQLLTTGSLSVKNYSESKAGALSKFNHSLGACVVELKGNHFFTRQLNALDNGSFCDLTHEYFPDRTIKNYKRVSGVVLGDLHCGFIDESVYKATFETENSILNFLNPENIYLHDVLDFFSQNHHHKGNLYIQYAKHHAKMHNVQSELDRLVDFHNKHFYKSDTNIYYIASNHNDAFSRWLNECDPKQDMENALLYYKTQAFLLEHTKLDNGALITPNPLAAYMVGKIENEDKTFFPGRNTKVVLYDIDLSQHGDKGINGSFGTIKAFANTCTKTITGHGHSPGIEKGAYRVGTSSKKQLGYNSGYSSWLHTHCIIYPNGKRSLINIIDGEWRIE